MIKLPKYTNLFLTIYLIIYIIGLVLYLVETYVLGITYMPLSYLYFLFFHIYIAWFSLPEFIGNLGFYATFLVWGIIMSLGLGLSCDVGVFLYGKYKNSRKK